MVLSKKVFRRMVILTAMVAGVFAAGCACPNWVISWTFTTDEYLLMDDSEPFFCEQAPTLWAEAVYSPDLTEVAYLQLDCVETVGLTIDGRTGLSWQRNTTAEDVRHEDFSLFFTLAEAGESNMYASSYPTITAPGDATVIELWNEWTVRVETREPMTNCR